MKRDMNLVREILLWAESQENALFGRNPELPEYSKDQIAYHVYIMWQAGLVDAADATSMGSKSPVALLLNVTWAGHDFIRVAKNESVWGKVRSRISESGGAFTFEIMKDLLTAAARDQLGLS